MNTQQWETLVAVVRGETRAPVPVGFIIDSPWLPNWAGHSILDYFTDDRIFLEDNLRAIGEFPAAMFLPGFWSEYGMCTEPSAFGAVSVWEENAFPFARKVLHGAADAERLQKPDPRKDGLLPFVIKRLQHLEPQIEECRACDPLCRHPRAAQHRLVPDGHHRVPARPSGRIPRRCTGS